jgi:hypothetical protein
MILQTAAIAIFLGASPGSSADCTQKELQLARAFQSAFLQPRTQQTGENTPEKIVESATDSKCRAHLRSLLVVATAHFHLIATDTQRDPVAEARDACDGSDPRPELGEFLMYEREDPCSVNHILTLIDANDPLGARALKETRSSPFSEHASEWKDAIGAIGTSSHDRFRASWSSRSEVIRSWAVHRFLNPRNPSLWKPEDVALVIALARQEDRDVQSAPKAYSRLHSGYDDPDHPSARLQFLMRFLGRMGVRRAFRLVQPQNIKPDRISEHFPGEFLLYEHEWNERNGSSVSIDIEAELAGHAKQTFIEARWLETDLAAPHPDTTEIVRGINERAPRK